MTGLTALDRRLLLLLTALRLAAAALTPLAPDEAYYRVWAHALAPGYLDHPPMVAIWIGAGTALAGDTKLGIRLLGPFAALLGTLLLANAANALRPGTARAAAWLLNGTLLLNAGAIILTPDTPLLFFWTATLWAMARLIARNNAAWWLAAGAAAGLALDSKYTAALLAPALLLWLLLPANRHRFRTWHPYAAVALARALFAPVLAWNAVHHWASFAKQGGREADLHPLHALRALAELALGQLGLATPLILAAGVLAIWRLRHNWRDPAKSLLLCLTLVPAAVFLAHALGGDRVQANWPAPIYPAACLAAAFTGIGFWRSATLTGLALTAPIYAQAALAPFPLPRRLDPTLIRLAGFTDLAGETWIAAKSHHASFVAADEYGLASELAFHLHMPVAGIEPRWALFRLPRADFGDRTGIFLRSLRHAAPLPWAQATPLGTIERTRHGIVAETYAVFLVRGMPRQVAVWLPYPQSKRQ